MRKPALLVVLLAVACNRSPGDFVVAISPVEPTAADDLIVVFPSPAEDPNGDPVSYSYDWSVNGSSWGNEQTVPSDQTAKGEVWEVTVTATDGEEEGPSKTVSVTVGNTAPEVLELSFSPELPGVDDDVIVNVDAADLDGDPLEYQATWVVDGLSTGFEGLELPGGVTTKGEVWTVEVIADDGEAQSEAVSASVSIANTAPVMVEAAFTPSDVGYEDSVFTATASATDVDGDELEYIYTWLVDGEEVKSSTQPSLNGGFFNRGETVGLVVHANDGFLDSEPLTVDTEVLIANSIPQIAEVEIDPSTVYEKTLVTCLPKEWDDADPLDLPKYHYQWSVNTAEVATTETLTGDFFDKGDVLVCAATPYDLESEGDQKVSAEVTVSNSAPVVTAVTLSTTSPDETDVLTATISGTSDDDGDAVTYTYEWFVEGTSTAATATLDGDHFDRSEEVYVEVTPVDEEGLEGSTVSSDTATVENALPVVSGLTLTPSDAVTSDPVVAEFSGSDPDGDTITYAYSWSINGTVDTAVTNATLAANKHEKNDVIGLTVTPTDSEGGAGATVTASPLTIGNTAPSFDAVTISPSEPLVSETLTCTASGWDDDDDDTEGYRYAWTNGAGSTLGTVSTLSSGFTKGDSITCTATAWDGDDEGNSRDDTVDVENSEPVVDSVTVNPSSADESTTLTATATSSDDDGDTVTLTYQWYAGSQLIGTGVTVDGDDFDKADVVRVKVTPNDSTTNGDAVFSSPGITIDNSRPVISAVSVTPATAYTADTLTAVVSSSDADDDSINLTYVWSVNSSAVLTSTVNTLASSYTVKHDTIGLRVTPSDGEEDGSAYTLTTALTVQNSVPDDPTIALTPALAMSGVHDLACEITTESSDEDGDSVSYTFAWQLDSTTWSSGVLTSTHPGDAIDKSNTAEDDQWQCTVVATDGDDDSSAVSSDLLTVLPECDNSDTWSGTDKSGGSNSNGVTVFDVDEDGADDITFCNTGDDEVQIYFGDGSGAFSSYNTFTVGGVTKCAAFGDVDGDGNIDMVSASRVDGKVYLIAGKGGGSFETAFTNVSQSDEPTWVDLSDIDGDGDQDLLVTLAGSTCIARRLNNGFGSFSSSSCIVGVNARPVTGDVDNDGRDELITVSGGALTVSEFNGSGGIASSSTISPSSLNNVEAAFPYDVDDDGDMDIIAFGSSSSDGSDAMVTFLNYYDSYTDMTECVVGNGLDEIGMHAGDFDDDGTPDFATSDGASTSTYTIYLND